jgi:small GTP-binding protein
MCRKAERTNPPANNGTNNQPREQPTAEPANYKILIIGDPAVGKTSLLLRFVKGSFSGDTMNTVGSEEYLSKELTVDGQKTTLNIWDTAGQEKFRTITSSYYRGAEGVIIVFDLNRQETFDHVAKWHEQIVRYASEEVPVIVVGNKSDLEKVVDESVINSICKEKLMHYYEASAANGNNVEQVFTHLAKLIGNPGEE